VNLGTAQSGAPDRDFDFDFTLYGETATLRAGYPTPSRGNAFDVGGGYMFNRRFGIGGSFTNVMHADPVDLTVILPHPFFFNAFGTGMGVTNEALARTERSISGHLMIVAVDTGRVVVRVYGGVTRFMYSADMVQDITATQTAGGTPQQNTVTITGFNSEMASGGGFGFNAGGDFSYMFNDTVGVGAGVRFTRGNVKVDFEPMSEVEQTIRVGGTDLLVGLRLRLGR